MAVLIAVFGALAPTLSHALTLAHGSSPAWAEVCSSTRTRWMALDETTNAAPRTAAVKVSADSRAAVDVAPVSTDFPDGQESLPSLLHCPFCLLLADHALPASPFSPHFFVALRTSERAAARPVIFFFTHFALTPPPRGPPAFS